MNEQKLLKKQFFKYMRSNLITFVLVFIIFVLFITAIVARVTYTSVNVELTEEATRVVNYIKNRNDNSDNNANNEKSSEYNAKFPESFFNESEENGMEIINVINNPKVICIIRDEDGEITSTSGFGTNVNEYIIELDFDENLIDKTYEVIVDDEYYYKGLTIDLSEIDSSESGYIQFLINIDTEKELVQIYSRIIFLSALVGIVISAIASIVLSRKTLEPLYNMLKKQNEFVQNVSHELRTPLTIIQAKQELLLSDPNAKIIDKTEDISLTLSETKRLSKLVKDLMLLVRADNKQLELQKEETEIDEMLKNIGKTYEEIFELENKKLELDLNYGKLALIDTNKIYQLIVILLDNSLKYTEEGDSVTISSYLKDNKCVIEVRDTGIGISDEAIKHVFERFYREDKARSRETGGSGLGLSIADMIVTAHGGTIKAAHNGEKGTIFIIKLPR